jgi:hypothetical protein
MNPSEHSVSPSNSAPNPPPESLVGSLKAAVAGLLWMSESDYPFDVMEWPADALGNSLSTGDSLSAESLLQLTGHDAANPVETLEVRDFFADAIAEQDWHEAPEKKTVQRFRDLLTWLESYLTHLKVYRVGAIEIDVYIVGQIKVDQANAPTHAQSSPPSWLCLSTKVVET